MKSLILALEKVVMAVMSLSRFLKFKSGDAGETAIIGLIDGVFEKLLG